MKKIALIIGILVSLLAFISCSESLIEEPQQAPELKSTHLKTTGFDDWGLNWQAHQFRGYLVNMLLGDTYFKDWSHFQQYVYHGEGPDFWDMLVSDFDYFPYLMPAELLDARLVAHWNDDLISSDGVYPSSWIDSDAWIVFKYSMRTKQSSWSHMRKLVARHSSDELRDGIWYNDEGMEIGFESLYWPELIVVQVVNTGDVPPFFYPRYISPNGPGYGH